MKFTFRPAAGLSVVVAFLLLAACASSPEPEVAQPIDVAPEWFQVESEEGYYYGFGQGNSARANNSNRQAEMHARQGIAASMSADIQSMAQEGARQDLDDPTVMGAFELATRELVDTTVRGAQRFEYDRQREEDGSITTWIGMRLAKDEAMRTHDDVLDRMDQMLGARE